MDFSHIDVLKSKLDSLRPLPSEAVRNLEDVYRVEWTYHSNAIEGNTLSLVETKIVLEEGLTIGGKKLREHFEVINHAEAIEYVKTLATKQTELDERVLKDIHYLVLKGIDNQNAGQYRKINVRISGSQHLPPHFLKVPEDMQELVSWYYEQKDRLHPVELATRLHFKFAYVHPFADGNGRTARLLMNFILMSYRYPPTIIKADPEKRIAYYQALEKASVENNIDDFIALVAQVVEESLYQYISAVE
ncbi:Fic/DOC family protein [Aneurinibacillus soli]|uniref:Fic/DOC family protein n=1 Tax=Aneurinibacillus soli TaxID=1500254 RepID=A0A0U5BA55_9BACL|nr:Fic family protein [Aneurinibacillus soli]PYE61656.1 Fic/DOC family protein [Aneurinibacillus soli]BAU28486.1 Fic/DOC family protein [Aneurinibacillus soli]